MIHFGAPGLGGFCFGGPPRTPFYARLTLARAHVTCGQCRAALERWKPTFDTSFPDWHRAEQVFIATEDFRKRALGGGLL